MKAGTFYPQITEAAKQENMAVEDVFERLVPLGIECVDIDTGSIKEQGTKYITEIEKSFDITTSSVFHYFVFDYKKSNAVSFAVEETKAELEACAEVGSPFIMPVPVIKCIHKDETERAECQKIVLDYFAGVSEYSKKLGITTVVENFSNTMSPYSYIDDISYILENVPEIRYVLDTGNYWFGGTDMLEACKKFSDKTVHVHLKDLCENEKGRLNICGRIADSVAIGDGMLPIFEAVDYLERAGREFAAIVEVNSCDHVLSAMEKSFENIRKGR